MNLPSAAAAAESLKAPSDDAVVESAKKKVKTDGAVEENEAEGSSSKKPLKPISNFFSKITKEDYRKNCDQEVSKAQLTVRAMVHHSDDEASKANVSRPKVKKRSARTHDADQIQVVHFQHWFIIFFGQMC